MTRIYVLYIFLLSLAFPIAGWAQGADMLYKSKDLSAILDTILRTEQEHLRSRDSVMNIYGPESKEWVVYQKLFQTNHNNNNNAKKIKLILSNNTWPDPTLSGPNGNRAICNVIQHVDPATRESYLPLMRQAVAEGKLEPRFLVRSVDRTATDKGELQIYGGQMKYYPESKSFNVWPIYDPVNVDSRRAAIGLGSIADWLRMRFDFEWDLEEQIKRSADFEKEKRNQ